MQERGDRGGGGHGLGQPEVEGELRGLGERGKRDEQRDYDGDAVVAPDIGSEDVLQARRAGLRGGHGQASQQRQAAEEGEDQGAVGPGLTGGAGACDEQERRDGDELPGDEQQHGIVRKHKQQHRQGKRRHDGVEAGVAVALGQVRGGVQKDHAADDQRQKREEDAQPVRAQREVHGGARAHHVVRPLLGPFEVRSTGDFCELGAEHGRGGEEDRRERVPGLLVHDSHEDR